jgi:hypothetical protein
MLHEDALKALHAGRAYHGWPHVEALLALWREYAGILHDPEAVHLAILFHDAVYDPRRTDNERASAALLRDWMAGTVPPARLEAAATMVLATERHAVPENLPPDLACPSWVPGPIASMPMTVPSGRNTRMCRRKPTAPAAPPSCAGCWHAIQSFSPPPSARDSRTRRGATFRPH